MKVVIFCGGLPLRLSEHGRPIPKPMMMIGYRPILWHVMRSYAEWGASDFVLCLGYGGDQVKSYFLNYNEALSNDFVLSGMNRDVRLLRTDIEGWRITFADTGLQASVGQRLRAVRHHVASEDVFCAAYGDIVTDARVDEAIAAFRSRPEMVAAFMTVRPRFSFHVVQQLPDGRVSDLRHGSQSDIWVNNGFFVFRQAIFDYLGEADDLVGPPSSGWPRKGGSWHIGMTASGTRWIRFAISTSSRLSRKRALRRGRSGRAIPSTPADRSLGRSGIGCRS